MKRIIAFAVLLSLSAAIADAQIVNIIGDHTTDKAPDMVGPNSALGNGDFQANGVGTTDVLTFAGVDNWFNLNGAEDQNFGVSNGTNGSPQDDGGSPGSRSAQVYGSIVAGNDTGYVVQSAGESFNFASYLGAFGNNYSDETYNAHLITSTTGLTADTDWTTDVSILGTATFEIVDGFFSMARENGFYVSQAGDVGQTVYLALELLPNSSTRFPRVDVVSLSVGELVPVTPLAFEFNAADNPPLTNPTDSTTVWNPSIDGRSQDPENSPTERFTFNSPTTANVVNDPSVPGITHSYSAGGEGRPTDTYTSGAGDTEASIEVWFKPASLAGGDQVIAEFGGATNGSYISLQDDTISFHNLSGADGVTLEAPALTSAEWTQVVANWTPTGDLELFVNGQSADTTSGLAVGRWAGGNPAGLGQFSGTLAIDGPLGNPVTDLDGDYNGDNVVDIADYVVWRDNLGAEEGTLPNDPNTGAIGTLQYDTWKANFGEELDVLAFDGEIAILRVYDEILTSQDVLDSFNTITGAGAIAASAAVPEPASVLLLALMATSGVVVRRFVG